MIYLDNAATTGVKPAAVTEAVMTAMKRYSVNPGRGGYSTSVKCSKAIYACRCELAEQFGAEDETAVIFTQNCTAAINTVIKGVLKSGDRVVASSMEHNSVMRPLYALGGSGVKADIAEVYPEDPEATVRSFERLIDRNTALVCCTHASNVSGHILPIEKIGELCRERRVPFLVDAAQTAGLLNISMKDMHIDYLCIAGHKGLYAPAAIGVLIALAPIARPLTEGGTGSASRSLLQPEELPDRFESGTLGVPLIFGLRAGAAFVRSRGEAGLYGREIAVAARLYDRLSGEEGIRLYSGRPRVGYTVPTLSFNIEGLKSEIAAERLGSRGLCVRGGLHCSPTAHRTLGTEADGTVRASFSAFNTVREAEAAADIIAAVARG